MNDDDILNTVRDSMTDVRMTTSARDVRWWCLWPIRATCDARGRVDGSVR